MISMTDVTKLYGKQRALSNVTAHLRSGAVTGIIGPNGSGKSTLVKCLLGLVQPTSGYISVDGVAIAGECSYRQRIGYVPQAARFPLELTGREVIDIIRGLRGQARSDEAALIDLLGLTADLGKRIKALSGGTRQKLSLVLACMYGPEILVLDEPSAGLDPLTNIRLKDYVADLRTAGRTILLTTHIMSDLESLADDVLILLDGQLRYVGPVRELKLATEEPTLERSVAQLLQRGAA